MIPLDSLTIGYLMLDDSSGIPYLKIDIFWGFAKFIFQVFDRYEFTSKLFSILLMENVSFSDPHLHQITLRDIYSKSMHKHNFQKQ